MNMPKSKKGIAIETAVFMLTVVFALCSVITVISLITNADDRRANRDIESYADADRCGELFIAAVKNGSAAEFKLPEESEYNAEVTVNEISDGNYEYELLLSRDGEAVLSVGVRQVTEGERTSFKVFRRTRQEVEP